MSLTLATATTEVRYLVNETTASFWSDTEIQGWIQEGVLDLCSRALLVQDVQDITLKASTLYYTSSDESWIADVLKVYAAYYDDGSSGYRGLIKDHPKMIGHQHKQTSGAPRFYNVFDKKIFVWPLTTSAIVSAGGVITVLYHKATNDITLLDDEFQYLPVLFAASKCKMKDMKYGEANLLLTQYLNGINFERADKINRSIDAKDQFKTPGMTSPAGRGRK
jgi:hypothetical protein